MAYSVSYRPRLCVETHFARCVGSLTGELDVISRLKCLYMAEINARKWGAYVFTHTWSPLICQVINRSSKKVGIAAIHPDFRAAMPRSLMEYAGRILNSLTSSSAPCVK